MTFAPITADARFSPVADARRLGGETHRAHWRSVPVHSAFLQLDPHQAHAVPPRGSYRPMTTADEVSFAWALAAAAREFFTPGERAWICITLGAGDSTRIVEHLLAAVVRHNRPLSDDLLDSAFDWFVGFLGTDREPRLRALVESLCPFAVASPQTRVDWPPRTPGR